MTKIKGICEGGTAFTPLKAGDWVMDEEGESLFFIRYTASGWSGEFRCTYNGPIYTLPLAGLRPFSIESGPTVDMSDAIAAEIPVP